MVAFRFVVIQHVPKRTQDQTTYGRHLCQRDTEPHASPLPPPNNERLITITDTDIHVYIYNTEFLIITIHTNIRAYTCTIYSKFIFILSYTTMFDDNVENGDYSNDNN